MKIRNESDIPAGWPVLRVKKTALVRVRACNGVEQFSTPWGELTSDPSKDVIIIQGNGKEYPIKKDIFAETYEAVPLIHTESVIAGYGFRKKSISKVVPVPEGIEVELVTLEGTLTSVKFPDYIAIGPVGEVYANTKEFFDQNLTVV